MTCKSIPKSDNFASNDWMEEERRAAVSNVFVRAMGTFFKVSLVSRMTSGKTALLAVALALALLVIAALSPE